MTLVGGPISAAVGTPIVNAGSLYINGLNFSFTTTTTITVQNGACRDSTNQTDIVFGPTVVTTTNPFTTQASTLVINIGQQGALGIDTGTVAASTFYAVYIVGDSLLNNAPTALLSKSFTAPLLPVGYDVFRRIGAVKTDGASHILPFWQAGNASQRTMWYDTLIAELTATAAAAFTAQDLSAAVPAGVANALGNCEVIIEAAITPNAAGNFIEFRPTGSSSTNGNVKMSGDVAAVLHTDQLRVIAKLNSASPALLSVDWITDAATTGAFSVAGYVDNL